MRRRVDESGSATNQGGKAESAWDKQQGAKWMRAAAGFPFDFAQDRTRLSGRKELALQALEDHPFIYQ